MATALACSKGFQNSTTEDSAVLASQDPNLSETPRTPTTPSEPTRPPYLFKPLLWESVRQGSELWSEAVFHLIQTEARSLLQAEDFPFFCPTFAGLSENEKVNAAGFLISAMVKYESRFNPLSRYQETTLGTDPVTGLPVWSEGLLQLSYQDTLAYPFCEFDWSQDKNLSATDPRKSILDPIQNLQCGVRILSEQVRKKGRLILSSGAYWAVIKKGSPYEKLDEIAGLVQTLDFCHQ